jgi:hypothetical protein
MTGVVEMAWLNWWRLPEALPLPLEVQNEKGHLSRGAAFRTNFHGTIFLPCKSMRSAS